MTRRSPLTRTLAVLFAIAQLLLPPVATWADAAVEKEASARAMDVVHIEAHTNNGCHRAHPSDCALCHAASVSFTGSTAPTFRIATLTGGVAAPLDARAAGASADDAWDARPRAPPALS